MQEFMHNAPVLARFSLLELPRWGASKSMMGGGGFAAVKTWRFGFRRLVFNRPFNQ
jgi:hypothetical protein